MTLSIYEFADLDDASGEPRWPEVRRRTALALSNTYHAVGETTPIAAIIVSNDDGTTGARVRFSSASSGANADQGDIFIAANSTATFRFPRKRRTETGDLLFLNAVADT